MDHPENQTERRPRTIPVLLLLAGIVLIGLGAFLTFGTPVLGAAP